MERKFEGHGAASPGSGICGFPDRPVVKDNLIADWAPDPEPNPNRLNAHVVARKWRSSVHRRDATTQRDHSGIVPEYDMRKEARQFSGARDRLKVTRGKMRSKLTSMSRVQGSYQDRVRDSRRRAIQRGMIHQSRAARWFASLDKEARPHPHRNRRSTRVAFVSMNHVLASLKRGQGLPRMGLENVRLLEKQARGRREKRAVMLLLQRAGVEPNPGPHKKEPKNKTGAKKVHYCPVNKSGGPIILSMVKTFRLPRSQEWSCFCHCGRELEIHDLGDRYNFLHPIEVRANGRDVVERPFSNVMPVTTGRVLNTIDRQVKDMLMPYPTIDLVKPTAPHVSLAPAGTFPVGKQGSAKSRAAGKKPMAVQPPSLAQPVKAASPEAAGSDSEAEEATCSGTGASPVQPAKTGSKTPPTPAIGTPAAPKPVAVPPPLYPSTTVDVKVVTDGVVVKDHSADIVDMSSAAIVRSEPVEEEWHDQWQGCEPNPNPPQCTAEPPYPDAPPPQLRLGETDAVLRGFVASREDLLEAGKVTNRRICQVEVVAYKHGNKVDRRLVSQRVVERLETPVIIHAVTYRFKSGWAVWLAAAAIAGLVSTILVLALTPWKEVGWITVAPVSAARGIRLVYEGCTWFFKWVWAILCVVRLEWYSLMLTTPLIWYTLRTSDGAQMLYCPHMVSCALSEGPGGADPAASYRQRILRLAQLDIEDAVALQIIEGSVQVALAVGKRRGFWVGPERLVRPWTRTTPT